MYGVKKCTRCKYTTINPDDASCPDPEGAPLTVRAVCCVLQQRRKCGSHGVSATFRLSALTVLKMMAQAYASAWYVVTGLRCVHVCVAVWLGADACLLFGVQIVRT